MARQMSFQFSANTPQSMGGKARAKKLTAKRRKAIAKKAAQARWAKPR